MKVRTRPPLTLTAVEDSQETPPPAESRSAKSRAGSGVRAAGASSKAEAAAAPSAVKPATERPKSPKVSPYLYAALAAALWIAGVVFFPLGFDGGLSSFEFTPFKITVISLLALGPVGLLFAVANAVRHGSILAAEARRARELSDAMVAPAALASEQAVALVAGVRTEIAQAVEAAERARDELKALRETLASETVLLNEAAETARRTARSLAEELSAEREAMTELGAALERQAGAIVESVERQTRIVADVSDLAQAQCAEAEAVLVARAADLAAAASEAQDAARVTADDLARQTLRLEAAGTGVSEQVRASEESLSEQRAALVAAAFALRTDQEDFSAQIETQRAQLLEALSVARTATGELNESSIRGAESLLVVVQSAAAQFKTLAAEAETERAGVESNARDAFDRFARIAAETRDELVAETGRALAALSSAAEEARKSADAAADAAQARIDRLTEAAFEAGRTADEAFEARLDDARRLIEETSSLSDQAGVQASERLGAHIAGIRSALGDMEATLHDLEARAAQMPDEAKSRLDEIRSAVEQGLEALAAAARKAAEETQAVDASFQERVRRNYEMLNEAVRLMGVVTGGEARSAALEAPAPRPERAAPRTEEHTDGAPSSAAGLRGKLRLTPTDADEAVKSVFETPRSRREGEGWTWRDLLGGMDRAADEAETPDEALADEIQQLILSLGVDPNALLPRSRVEEAAASLLGGDADGARELVRRIAPAAVRRVSRRILTDRPLRLNAERFLGWFDQAAAGAVSADADGDALKHLLASPHGRTFLLVDAAIGDLL